MERLTKHEGGYIVINGCASVYPSQERKRAPMTSAIVRLSAYEDSGLTPEEVAELAKIVRCKDCKYAEESIHKNRIICSVHETDFSPDDFCSCGEKKGE